MKNNEQRRTRLKSLILLVAFTGIMLIASTYAWFSTQRAVTLSNLSGIVNVAEGLEISLDAANWSNAIDLSTVTLNAVTTADTLGSYSATANHVPSELKPASTIGTTGGTGVTLYTGTFDGTGLNSIVACDESITTAASANYAGYYAFDIFLRDSSAGNAEQQLLLSAGSQAIVLATGGDDTTGLQNTVRLALAEYSATTDIGAFQEEIVSTTTASTSTISQVAIWEPNANYHVHYMVQNASRYSFDDASRDKLLTTYALNDETSITSITNVYDLTEGTRSERLTEQSTVQTSITVPTTDSDSDGLEDLPTSYALTEKTALTDISSQAFSIAANKITRLRVYVWLEGQDIDCVNYASHGGGIEIDIGIEKGGNTETTGTTLASVTNDNIGDYIDLGNNIVGTEATTDDWRILYVDGSTVYAILADYLPNSTNYAANAGLDTTSTYTVYSSTDRDTLLTGLTTNTNWNGLANGISGATVTGTPTGELLMNSYNTKNGTSKVYTNGPTLDSSSEDYDLYVPHTSRYGSCYGYWFASPKEGDTSNVWNLQYYGFPTVSNYNNTGVGIRPVVALTSDTSATLTDGVWTVEN